MRILYSHRIQSKDGQGVHLEELVAALRADGHAVEVAGPSSYGKASLGGESRAVALARQVLPAWAAELAELAYNVPAYVRLSRAVRRFRPDVVYERANLFYVAGILAARRHGLPLLLEVNAPLADERGRFGGLRLSRLARATERLTWRHADRALPVTEVLAARIAAERVPRTRIAVVPNGIDLAQFAGPAPKASPAPSRTVVLGFVGFVRDWHGLDRVVRALAGKDSPEPGLVLHVVGDGPALPGLRRLAAELGVADRVRFFGTAERAAVPGLVAAFDIALQPAAVAYASPLKVFEYMAAGRAIVAPDQPNIREVLEHGRTALLFDPAADGALWQTVLRLSSDAALRQALGAAAREDVLRRDLTWAGNARRVVAFARAEIARRSRGPAVGGEHGRA